MSPRARPALRKKAPARKSRPRTRLRVVGGRTRTPRSDAERIWKAGVAAAHGERRVRETLRLRGNILRWPEGKLDLREVGRIAVVGGGKAGASMAAGVEAVLSRRPRRIELTGWVNVPDRDVRKRRRIVLHGARDSHANLPTAQGVAGTQRILELVAGLDRNDLVIVLVSGGGSALLPAPAEGLTLPDLLQTTDLLMNAGASIDELNAVRKHLSTIQGGGLAGATKARVLGLVLSDVVGDPLDAIASGPTAPDPTTFADAWSVLGRYDLVERVPPAVRDRLRRGEKGEVPETAKRLGSRVTNTVIGNNRTAIEAAAREARRLGYRVLDLGSRIQGEARAAGVVLAGIARGVRDGDEGEVCLLSGGETPVTLHASPGRGGRNQELALSALEHLGEPGLEGITFLAAGTDGEDGPTDAAGAVADTRVAAAARRKGLDPRGFLGRHDAYSFFEPTRGLFRTGPTGTNVMDLRVILVR